MKGSISVHGLQRLPIYLKYLKLLPDDGPDNISSKQISLALNLGEIQVRKDLAEISSGGKPKVGYVIKDLISDIEAYLGYDNTTDAVLVGAGKLGRALMSYKGFGEYGLNIIAAFDCNKRVQGIDESGKAILDIEELQEFCNKNKILMGIITVPENYAQEVCDRLVESGIIAVWNFAPVHLKTPKDVFVKNENMSISFALISNHLAEMRKAGRNEPEKKE